MLGNQELRDKVQALLADKLALDEFEDWFVQNSWNIHRSDDSQAKFLAYAIELRLAERDSGHLPEEQFRSELQQLLENPVSGILLVSSAASTGTGTTLAFSPMHVTQVLGLAAVGK